MGHYPEHHEDTARAIDARPDTSDTGRTEPASAAAAHHESVTWIGTEATAYEPPAGRLTALIGPHRKRLWIGAMVVLMLALAAAVWMHVASTPAALTPLSKRHAPPLVSVLVPGVQPVSAEVTVTGTIEARHDLPIGDGGQAGRITAVYVQVGDHVRKGQILAQIDDSVLKPQVSQLVASLAKAHAQAKLSAAEYRRALAIGPQGGLSVQNIEQRQATAAMDAASVRMVAAQLAHKRAELALTRVVAPVAGIVLTRKAEVGQVASPGGPALFSIEDQGRVELVGQVAEQELAALKVGQHASVHLVGYRRPFAGHIWLLNPTVDPQSRLGQVRIALDPNPALRPGAFAHATIMVSRAERPVVPQTAILSDNTGTYVYIVDSHDRVERRNVTVGNVTASGVVIDHGLTGRERVVNLAGGFLRTGETVGVAGTRSARS